MNTEHISPRDLLLAAPWKHALFTTYSLSLSFLESVPLNDLAQNQNLTVLVDLEGYRASLSDAGAVSAGRSYELAPLDVTTGVFHPKITILVDAKGLARASVGSGNLTFGGWGRNAEVIDFLAPATDARAYGDLSHFLEQLAANVGPTGRIKSDRSPDLQVYSEACRNASRSPTDGETRVLHSFAGRIDEQIAAYASELGGAVGLTVVSPFFSGHSAIQKLASALGCADVSVAVPPLAPSIFDFEAARLAGFEVRAVSCDMFCGGRSLHAKLFDVTCSKGRLVVTGSANATHQALGGQNVEAVVARVYDRTRSLGWRTSGTYGVASGEQEPARAKGPCLIARYDGASAIGHIFGGHKVAGDWAATFLAGTLAEPLGTVAVGEDGAFAAAFPASLDPTVLNVPGQLTLHRDGASVRGWLMLDAVLDAVREKGPLARSIVRIIHGVETASDMAGFLAYLKSFPEELLSVALTMGTSRAASKKPAVASGSVVALASLAPGDALVGTTQSGARGADAAFHDLQRTLLRQLERYLPAREERDDEQEQNKSGKKSKGSKGTAKVPNRDVSEALESFCQVVAKAPVGPLRGAALPTLFNMIIFIAPHADQPDSVLYSALKRWRWLARGCRTGGSDLDALDLTMATLLTAGVIIGVQSPTQAHAELQRWLGRILSDEDRVLLAPDPRSLDAQRTAPDATPVGWADAWSQMLETRTSWAAATEMLTALRSGSSFEELVGLDASEREIIGRIAAGRLSLDRLAVASGVSPEVVACPKCHCILPTMERARLRQDRVASCRNRCGRIVLDLTL